MSLQEDRRPRQPWHGAQTPDAKHAFLETVGFQTQSAAMPMRERSSANLNETGDSGTTSRSDAKVSRQPRRSVAQPRISMAGALSGRPSTVLWRAQSLNRAANAFERQATDAEELEKLSNEYWCAFEEKKCRANSDQDRFAHFRCARRPGLPRRSPEIPLASGQSSVKSRLGSGDPRRLSMGKCRQLGGRRALENRTNRLEDPSRCNRRRHLRSYELGRR